MVVDSDSKNFNRGNLWPKNKKGAKFSVNAKTVDAMLSGFQ